MLWRAVLVICTLALGACATRPPASDFQRRASYALAPTETTPLAAAIAPLARAHPGESGFRLLISGTDALQMRVALARSATRTLDLQYYIAEEDNTGKLLLEAALRAAERGVRVRMLVDDLNFKDIDDIMAVLNANPRIEIRVFNPFSTAGEGPLARLGNMATHLDKLTRRMHNKAMIADNQIAIVGGRNLGDEYFDASPNLSFRDLDVLTAGPITRSISSSFDVFWNSPGSYPLRALNRQHFDPAQIKKVRNDLRQHWRTDAATFDAKPLNATPLARQIGSSQLSLTWAKAELLADTPRKIDAPSDSYVSPPLHRLGELAAQAQKEFLVISPYFVPHDAGVELLADLARRGVKVELLTNSLAATDAVAVQAGYERYRVPMLKAGIHIYEFKPTQNERRHGLVGLRSRASLHAKAYVIDRKILVIGSMNLDRRSASLNTELALFIYSPALADQVAQVFDRATSPSVSYRVMLVPPDQLAKLKAAGGPMSPLYWTTEENGRTVHYDFDPDAGLWRNIMTGFFSMLPVENQL